MGSKLRFGEGEVDDDGEVIRQRCHQAFVEHLKGFTKVGCEAIGVLPFGGLFDEDPVEAGSAEGADGAGDAEGGGEAFPVALVGVGEVGGFAVDRAGAVAAGIEVTAIVEAKVFDGFEEAASLIGEDERDVSGQGVVEVFDVVQNGSAEGNAIGDDGPDIGGGIDPGFGVGAGAADDAGEAGGADVGLSGIVIASHDDGVRDGADVVEDFLELSFAA